MGNRESCSFCKACDESKETSKMAKNPYEKLKIEIPESTNVS